MGRGGHPAILDYKMSEKFGLDWKEYDYTRMQEMILIMAGIQNQIAKKNKDAQNKGAAR